MSTIMYNAVKRFQMGEVISKFI